MNNQNPTVPAELAGSVTEIVITISGIQAGAIDLNGAGTEYARLTLRWGKLHMTFTSAAQVQHVRGYFAMAGQGMLGAARLATLPIVQTSDAEAATAVAVTWTSTPGGSASIEQLPIPRLNRVVNYVALRIGAITFRILDTSALESANELLTLAHNYARTAFPDGAQYQKNPTTPSWHPNKDVAFLRTGSRWIPRR